ncbi:hypothetical protein DIPPA_28909 [Diplonema papillatum]|nr:hypothetical protein DIPPA_28909 [Diplonema papillatum]
MAPSSRGDAAGSKAATLPAPGSAQAAEGSGGGGDARSLPSVRPVADPEQTAKTAAQRVVTGQDVVPPAEETETAPPGSVESPLVQREDAVDGQAGAVSKRGGDLSADGTALSVNDDGKQQPDGTAPGDQPQERDTAPPVATPGVEAAPEDSNEQQADDSASPVDKQQKEGTAPPPDASGDQLQKRDTHPVAASGVKAASEDGDEQPADDSASPVNKQQKGGTAPPPDASDNQLQKRDTVPPVVAPGVNAASECGDERPADDSVSPVDEQQKDATAPSPAASNGQLQKHDTVPPAAAPGVNVASERGDGEPADDSVSPVDKQQKDGTAPPSDTADTPPREEGAHAEPLAHPPKAKHSHERAGSDSASSTTVPQGDRRGVASDEGSEDAGGQPRTDPLQKERPATPSQSAETKPSDQTPQTGLTQKSAGSGGQPHAASIPPDDPQQKERPTTPPRRQTDADKTDSSEKESEEEDTRKDKRQDEKEDKKEDEKKEEKEDNKGGTIQTHVTSAPSDDEGRATPTPPESRSDHEPDGGRGPAPAADQPEPPPAPQRRRRNSGGAPPGEKRPRKRPAKPAGYSPTKEHLKTIGVQIERPWVCADGEALRSPWLPPGVESAEEALRLLTKQTAGKKLTPDMIAAEFELVLQLELDAGCPSSSPKKQAAKKVAGCSDHLLRRRLKTGAPDSVETPPGAASTSENKKVAGCSARLFRHQIPHVPLPKIKARKSSKTTDELCRQLYEAPLHTSRLVSQQLTRRYATLPSPVPVPEAARNRATKRLGVEDASRRSELHEALLQKCACGPRGGSARKLDRDDMLNSVQRMHTLTVQAQGERMQLLHKKYVEDSQPRYPKLPEAKRMEIAARLPPSPTPLPKIKARKPASKTTDELCRQLYEAPLHTSRLVSQQLTRRYATLPSPVPVPEAARNRATKRLGVEDASRRSELHEALLQKCACGPRGGSARKLDRDDMLNSVQRMHTLTVQAQGERMQLLHKKYVEDSQPRPPSPTPLPKIKARKPASKTTDELCRQLYEAPLHTSRLVSQQLTRRYATLPSPVPVPEAARNRATKRLGVDASRRPELHEALLQTCACGPRGGSARKLDRDDMLNSVQRMHTLTVQAQGERMQLLHKKYVADSQPRYPKLPEAKRMEIAARLYTAAKYGGTDNWGRRPFHEKLGCTRRRCTPALTRRYATLQRMHTLTVQAQGERMQLLHKKYVEDPQPRYPKLPEAKRMEIAARLYTAAK